MKKIILLIVVLTSFDSLWAQNVSINETGLPGDPSAILDIFSHSAGVLVPRLRTIEREDIQGPAEGLLTYDIDTRTFWYYSLGTWKEILKAGAPNPPSGTAGGDLSGNYPDPRVVKIQNNEIADGIPSDKQVLKWDVASNNWKGRNDSLFLPYIASAPGTGGLFSITNTFNGFAYNTTILLRLLGDRGMNQNNNSVVWGDATCQTLNSKKTKCNTHH